MHRIPPSKRMEQAFFQSIFEGKNILSGMVQAGAQLMLQRALEEEVTVFLGRGHYKRGKRLQNGYRNGYEPAAISSNSGRAAANTRDRILFPLGDSGAMAAEELPELGLCCPD